MLKYHFGEYYDSYICATNSHSDHFVAVSRGNHIRGIWNVTLDFLVEFLYAPTPLHAEHPNIAVISFNVVSCKYVEHPWTGDALLALYLLSPLALTGYVGGGFSLASALHDKFTE